MTFLKKLQSFFLVTLLAGVFFGSSVHGMKDEPDNATEALEFITKETNIADGLWWLSTNIDEENALSNATTAINHLAKNLNKIQDDTTKGWLFFLCYKFIKANKDEEKNT